jgi:shikimate dehydrogenase
LVEPLSVNNTHSKITPDTNLACVIGNPIEQSKSPIIHTLFAKQFDIALDYQKRFAAADAFTTSVNDFFSQATAIGANVTMPFKHDALEWADTLSPQAERAGAVNTIIRTSDGFVGDNSDGVGLVRDLQQHQVNLSGAKLLIIGAGGAAQGALPALLEAGIKKVSVYNRSQAKAEQLIQYTHTYSPDVLELYQPINNDFDLIVNATSLSLSDELPNLPDTIFEAHPAVYDMVYKSEHTKFLQHAQKLGCSNTIDGLGMLVEQAAHSFYLWFGKKPDSRPVYQYLRELTHTQSQR